jgi:hypothetical protein
MEQAELFTLPLRYTTLPTSANRIDATDLGRSIRGIGRLSNLVVHTLYVGSVPERRTIISVKFYIGPPASGSIRYDLAALLGASQLPLWWGAFQAVAKPLFEYLIGAILSARIGRDREKEAMLGIIQDLINKNDAAQTLSHLGHMNDKDWLQKTISDLLAQGERSMRDAAAPVGRSSGPIDIGKSHLDAGVTIDEAAAEVLRAKEALVVGDQQTFLVKFAAVDKSAKRCKVEIVGQEGREISCRITDPALMTTGNIYTHSLNNGQVAEIDAKPVLQEGAIRTLYISDGRAPPDGTLRLPGRGRTFPRISN